MRLPAECSPNVKRALWQRTQGIEPDGEVVIPGVLTWADYCHRRATWDAARQSVGLDARFYEGPELKLWPQDWLNRAEALAFELRDRKQKRVGKGLGIDPAEGGDHTVWVAVDEWGMMGLLSIRTSDTSEICSITEALGAEYGVSPENWVFDRGGGGKEHADRLRKNPKDGYNRIRTIAFGESILPDIKRSKRMFKEKLEVREDKYMYFNRRAEMYGECSLLFDPGMNPEGWALPPQEWFGKLGHGRRSLRDQMSKIPKEYHEGRLKIRPKDRQPGTEETRHKTLKEIIGHSPDELDALVLACHGLLHEPSRMKAGAA